MFTNDIRIEYKMCRQIMKTMYEYPNIMKKVGKKQKANAIQYLDVMERP